MSIFLGSSQIQGLFGTAVNAVSGASAFANPAPPISGGAVALNAGLFPNTSSVWTNYNGDVFVENAPLVGTSSIGFYQFNGNPDPAFADMLYLSGGLYTNGLFQGTNGAQSFTMMFYGTLGSLTQRRALLGNLSYTTTTSGSDAIFRTDTSPASGYCHLDLRSRNAASGRSNLFSIPYSSGSIMNFAITYDATTTSASLYVDGLLTATSGGFAGFQYTPFYNNGTNPRFGYNGQIDAETFNGTLGGFYVYNRVLTGTQISQSAAWFTQGNTVTPAQISGIQDINTAYLGSDLVYTKPTTTTTTTTSTTSTTTTSTTSTTKPPLSVLSLVVGGGGAGGMSVGGGGGAGGMVSGSLSLTPNTYAVTVGSGGLQSAGPVGLNIATQSGNPGQTSSFSTLIAFGGGGGMAYEGTQNTSNGGSGGGCSDTRLRQPAGGSTVLGGSGSVGQGNAGSNGTFGAQFGNGGGGAGQAGQVGNSGTNPRRAGAGGSGSLNSFRDGNATFYAGGGGGGGYNTAIGGLGGPGGGGNGGTGAGSGSDAIANTGAGGGGSGRNVDGTINNRSGRGGSGIVVIAYLTSSFSASAATAVSGGIITDFTSGSQVYRSHTFLSSSNLVIS
jgi:hypothetical protein